MILFVLDFVALFAAVGVSVGLYTPDDGLFPFIRIIRPTKHRYVQARKTQGAMLCGQCAKGDNNAKTILTVLGASADLLNCQCR